MKLSDGKRNHSVKRNSDPSSSGSHFCSGHKRFPPPYTCLIKSANQNNVNSTWGLQMLPKGDGGLKNPQTFPEDVNDMNLFSIQNFLSCSPENNKVTKKKKNLRRYDCYRKSRKQYPALHLFEVTAMLHYSKWTLQPSFQQDQIGTKKELQ